MDHHTAVGLILLGITAGVSWLAAASMRRGLLAPAEILTVLATLLVAVLFVVARSGGLLGLEAIGRNRAMWIASAITMLVALGWGRAAVTTWARRLVGVQLLALLALWRLMMITYDQHLTRTEFVAFGFVVAILGLTLIAARLALWTFAVYAGVVAGINVLIAFGASVVRIAGEETLAGIWSTGRSIGWVAVLLIGLVLATWRRAPMAWRTAGATLLVAGASFLLLRPFQGEGFDAVVVAAVALFTLQAALSLVTRRPWRRGLRIGSVPVGLFAAALIGPSVMVAASTGLLGAVYPWSAGVTAYPDADVTLQNEIGTPWVIGVAAFVLMVAVEVVLSRGVPRPAPIFSMAAVAIAVALLRYPLPLWAMVASLGGLAAGTAWVAIRYEATPVWLLAGSFAVMALCTALASDVLTVVVATGLAIGLGAAANRVQGRDEAILCVVGASVLAALAAVAATYVVGGVMPIGAYAVVAVGAALIVCAHGLRRARSG